MGSYELVVLVQVVGKGGGLAGELKVHMGVRGGGRMWGWGYGGRSMCRCYILIIAALTIGAYSQGEGGSECAQLSALIDLTGGWGWGVGGYTVTNISLKN